MAITLNGSGTSTFSGKATSALTASSDSDSTLVTKSYSGGGGGTTINYEGASAWGNVAANGTLDAGHNIASVNNSAPGYYELTWQTAMPSNDYSVVVSSTERQGLAYCQVVTQDTSGCQIRTAAADTTDTNIGFNVAVHSSNAIAPQYGVGADAWGRISDAANLIGGFNIASVVRVPGAPAGAYRMTFITPMPTEEYSVAMTPYDSNFFGGVSAQTREGFDVYLRTSASGNNLSNTEFSFTVHASSTVTPTYTWTRNGTTLEPANAGDTGSVGKFTGSTTGLSGYSFQYDVDGLARFAFGEQNIGGNDVGYMRYQHLTGGGTTNYTDVFQSNDDLKISTAGSVGIGSGSNSNITLMSDGKLIVNRASSPEIARFQSNGLNNFIFMYINHFT